MYRRLHGCFASSYRSRRSGPLIAARRGSGARRDTWSSGRSRSYVGTVEGFSATFREARAAGLLARARPTRRWERSRDARANSSGSPAWRHDRPRPRRGARGRVSARARDVRARPADVRIARRPAAPPGMDARPGVFRRGRSGRGGPRPAAEHREGIHRALLPELLHAVAEQAPARDLGERRRRGGARPRGRGRAHKRARRRRPDFRAGAPARQLGEAPGARARRGPRVRPRRSHRGRSRVLGRRHGRAARGRRLRRRRAVRGAVRGGAEERNRRREKSAPSASGRRAPPAGARHGDGVPAGRG